MIKYWLICFLSIACLAACEKQKQASAEVGAVPKQILDKATEDINKAQAIADQNMKAMENIDAPTEAQQ
ncbi:MAG: hypothetical protein WBP13_01510 [Methylophilaceae bacterium]